MNVVTGVSWNGTQIVVSSQSWNVQNGIIKSATNNANSYIDTVAYSPT